MLKIYVDESGNLGLNEGYFVIAMLVPSNSKRIKNIIQRFCAYHSIEEAHACHLFFPDRQFLVDKLNQQKDYTVSYIVVDKMMVNNEALFKSNNLLFNYLFSFLVKDIFKENLDDIAICLDNRNQKVASVNSLSEYIKIKAYTSWGFTKEVTFKYYDSRDVKALQMVDLVAHCVYKKYTSKKEDLYNKLNISKSIKFPIERFRDTI
jgi:hypothetical protein